MSAHLTEEEQLEALKRWWAENGKSLVIAVVLGVGGYFGFNSWQDNRQLSAETASAKYEEIVALLGKQEPLTDEESSTVNHLAGELKQAHGDTLYGVQAAMLLAKQAVEKNDLSGAEAELRWALEQVQSDNERQLVQLRLARVLMAQEKYDEVLSLANQPEQGAFAPLFAELKGDVLVTRGEKSAAAEAYQQALDALSPEQSGLSNALRFKLNNVQAAPVAEGA